MTSLEYLQPNLNNFRAKTNITIWFFFWMNNLIINKCNLLSKFIYSFKYFITNLTF
jgi:hypothetical protein